MQYVEIAQEGMIPAASHRSIRGSDHCMPELGPEMKRTVAGPDTLVPIRDPT